MFFEIARIVKHHKPKALFLENVAHLIRHDGGRTFRVITETLDGLGYDVHYKVLAASDYGVAQIRKRVCLICFRKDLQAEFSFPEPTFEDVAVEDFLESIVNESYFPDPNLVTFYKPDIETRTLDTYRLGHLPMIFDAKWQKSLVSGLMLLQEHRQSEHILNMHLLC